MKTSASVISVLILISAAFATNYTADYTAGNWLKVTRTIQVMDSSPCFEHAVSNVCINTGSVAPPSLQFDYATKVFLIVQNIGTLPRDGISIGESITYVPSGTKLTFSPAPSTNDGRQVSWEIGSLKANESKSVSYEFPATIRESSVSRIPAVSILSAPVMVSLSAPTVSKVGDKLSVSLKTSSGYPVPDTIVYVEYSDGSRQPVKTDRNGVATFTASRPGYYTYSIDGYRLSEIVSTRASDANEDSGLAAAAVVDKGIIPSVAGIFPALAAIFVIAVVALIIYNFLTSRKEEEDGDGVSQQNFQPSPSADAPVPYSQKFTFSQESQHDNAIRQTTRDILESRKKQLKEEEEKQQPQEQPEGAQAVFEASSSSDGLSEEVAAFEAKAREQGESAQEEVEIEKAIAELELIREKLRSRKSSGDAEAEDYAREESEIKDAPKWKSGLSSEAEIYDEQTPAKKNTQPKFGKKPASSSSSAGKPKKMKFSSRNIRKK